MNYYMPYFNMYPNMITPTLNTTTSSGILSRLLGKNLNLSNILNNTQKTLGIVNQAIPMFKQVSPIVKNAKTMFKVMNEFKKEEPSNTSNQQVEKIDNKQETQLKNDNNIGPTFFLN